MRDQIVFGDGWLEVELPDDVIEAPSGISLPLAGVEDLKGAVRDAISHPLDTPPLAEVARGRKTVVVAFDDPTVPCYAPYWEPALDAILEELVAGGVEPQNISLLCANALHRKFTHDELGKLIGERIAEAFRDRLTCHDAEDPDGILPVGRTKQGWIVDLNRRAAEADLLIYLNCSTTRGFSGGWKSICVGLSTYRSIAQHHTPDVMSMSFEKNRMHEMLDEMGALAEESLSKDRFFKVETVLANPISVGKVFAGSVGATRRAALDLNREHLKPRRELVEHKADVVLYGIPDWSPYAAFSSMNPMLTLISTGLGYLGGMIEAIGKPGCTVVLATPCYDRWDHERHPSYKQVWDEVLPVIEDPEDARIRFENEYATNPQYIEKYRNHYGFHGSHGVMALYPLKRMRHAGRVIVAGATEPSLVRHAGFDYADTVEAAIADARSANGGSANVALVRYPPAFNRQ